MPRLLCKRQNLEVGQCQQATFTAWRTLTDEPVSSYNEDALQSRVHVRLIEVVVYERKSIQLKVMNGSHIDSSLTEVDCSVVVTQTSVCLSKISMYKIIDCDQRPLCDTTSNRYVTKTTSKQPESSTRAAIVPGQRSRNGRTTEEMSIQSPGGYAVTQ